MAIILLFYKHSSPQNSEWMAEINKNGIDAALSKFCRQIPVSTVFYSNNTFTDKIMSFHNNCKFIIL